MVATALERPDFTGEWEFSPAFSRLQIAKPDDIRLVIEFQKPLYHFERTVRFGPRSLTFAIDVAVGGDSAPVERGDALVFPSLEWDGDSLVFRTRIIRSDGEAQNTIRYHLEKDGSVLVAEERLRTPTQHYDNYLVFRKRD